MKTLHKILFLLTLLTALSAPGVRAQSAGSQASNSLYVRPANLMPGTTGTLEFILDATDKFYGFQAEVTLPEGLEVVMKPDGKKPDIDLTDLVDGTYVIVGNVDGEGKILMGAFSSAADPAPIASQAGAIVSMKVRMAEDFTGGSIMVDGILMVTQDDQDFPLDPYEYVYAESITLSNETLELMHTESTGLLAIFHPENTTDRTITWTSSNESVATVDSEGNVTAVYPGSAVITATNFIGKAASCPVEVIRRPVEAINIVEIPKGQTHNMSVGDGITLTAEITPVEAVYWPVEWTSSDPEVATVSADGEVKALKAGTTVIRAAANGQIDERVVMVWSLSLTNNSLIADKQKPEVMQIYAIVRPYTDHEGNSLNIEDRRVSATSSDEDIATVEVKVMEDEFDEEGHRMIALFITPKDVGTATITVSTNSGYGLPATCTVSVHDGYVAPTKIALSTNDLIKMIVNDIAQLEATVSPDNATVKSVEWRSSNPEVASVDHLSGLVTAHSVGIATIYASTINGITDSCAVMVNSVSLSNTELLMRAGYSTELDVFVRPTEHLPNQRVTVESSDPAIVTAQEIGAGKLTFKALAPGTATITVTSVYNDRAMATCVVTVEPEDNITAVESISVSPTSLELEVGDTPFTLTATIEPENATDKTLTWRSDEIHVATVDQNGNVTPVAPGEATILVSSSNGKTAECKVTVKGEIVATEISITNNDLTLRLGRTAEIQAIVKPDNATDKSVSWTSADDDIASVDVKDGISTVTANALGTTTLTASCGSASATCTVTVIPEDPNEFIQVSGITLEPEELNMEAGTESALTATITPDNAFVKTVTWKSSDRSVATVSQTGVVSAVGEGVATIFASSANGLTATCLVTVEDGEIPVTGITLTNTTLNIRVGHEATLIPIITPANATNKEVKWESQDQSIATVDQNGKVTGVEVGETDIIVTSYANKNVTAICHVTVRNDFIPVESITVEPASLSFELPKNDGTTAGLTATVKPDEATDRTVTWKSSDWAVATVDETGMVTIQGAGKATIYASTSNGLTAEVPVTVIQRQVTAITLDKTYLSMLVDSDETLTATIVPETATDQEVIWSSNKPEIATVDQNGKVTAHSLGTAEITAASHSDSIIKATCDVDVIANKVTGIRLSVPPYQTFTLTEKPDGTYLMNLAEKSQCQLIATLEPVGIQNKKVTWESSDSDMVQVYSNGTLVSSLLPEGVNSISVVITAKVKEDNVTAMCTVTIVRGGSTGPEPTGAVLIIEPTYLRVDEGTTTQLTALIYPEDTYAGVVTWWSSKRDIATVSDKGLVTTLKPGSTIITAETTTGLIASCLVNVMPTSGIGGVESDDPVGIRPVTGGLEISGLAESTFVGVYNILGVPVFARKAGSHTLTVGIPARGTYIVRIGNRVRKIVI